MWHKIRFQNQTYPVQSGQNLLQSLLKHGVNLPFSCQKGICHTCLMRARSGTIPEEAQQGIAANLQAKHYFLPCICTVQSDMVIEQPDGLDFNIAAQLVDKKELSPEIVQILLRPEQDLLARGGQFIHIFNGQDSRPYSIAQPFDPIELHIQRHEKGRFSCWLCDQIQIGDTLQLSYPQGNNYYQAQPDELLILAGTGTGLAPLLGIAFEALQMRDHRGEIHLYHGAQDPSGLYQDQKLRSWAEQYDHFYYHPCLSNQIRIEQALQHDHGSLAGAWVHLAGSPRVVQYLFTQTLALGAEFKQIISDPYYAHHIPSDQPEADYPEPDPALWQALQKGKILKRILDEFYDAVYLDPVLSPYFYNTTKDRVKEKAYSFYRQLFSGEKVYFGDRPRNAHHWMVISDEIFDYRERLLQFFMFKHGLNADMMRRWVEKEEIYRSDIVKDKPRGRRIGDLETPADGYDQLELQFSTLCDGCQSPLEVGQKVLYHRRTGQVYCQQCRLSD